MAPGGVGGGGLSTLNFRLSSSMNWLYKLGDRPQLPHPKTGGSGSDQCGMNSFVKTCAPHDVNVSSSGKELHGQGKTGNLASSIPPAPSPSHMHSKGSKKSAVKKRTLHYSI